ncbi:MAG: hypothetical protein HQL96_12105 [Magnetococcales bacterium]|nr:hypothetical protein [Magnetococcales bacterium]
MFHSADEMNCQQCGTRISPVAKSRFAAGSAVLCPQCATPLIVHRKKPDQPLSEPMRAYLDFCRERHHTRCLPVNALGIRRFKHYLAILGASVRNVTSGEIRQFLQWIEETEGKESRHGFETNLRDFFLAMAEKKIRPRNPLPGSPANVTPELPEDLSEELQLFVEHQREKGYTNTLAADIRRLQQLEAYLGHAGKRLRDAGEEELNAFMAEIDRRLTLKQACGYALTLHDCFDLLVQKGLMSTNPETADFPQRQEMLDLILYSEESDLSSDPAFAKLRDQNLRQRRLQRLFVALFGIMLGFAVLALAIIKRHEISQLAKGIVTTTRPATKTTPPPAPPRETPDTATVAPVMPPPAPATLPEPPTPQPQPGQPVAPPPAPPPRKGCQEGDCRNGMGRFLYDDGSLYIGGWRNGRRDGAGEMRFPSGGGYHGVWQQGKLTRIDHHAKPDPLRQTPSRGTPE